MNNWQTEKKEIKKLALAIKGCTREEFPADLSALEDYIYKTYKKGNHPMSIKEGWFCNGADFDCEEPYIIIGNKDCTKKDRILVPETMAYYLRTHFCGSMNMHNGLKEDAVRDMQNKFKELLGVK